MFCRYCGNELPEDAKFCNNCGNPIAEPEPVVREVESPKEETPKQEAPKVVEMPKTPTPKIDWATASKMDAELYKSYGPKITPKMAIPVLIVAGILVAVVIWLISGTMKKPEHVSESGDYTLQLQDTFRFSSTKSSIRFEKVAFDKPQYDSASNKLSAPMTFVFRVDIPGKNYQDAYREWLNDFSVNGVQATSSAIAYWPESNDCYLEYRVHYDSVPADQSYLLTCKVNDRLSLHFSYDQSFWDNVDYAEAISTGQAILDDEYGIKYVDWQNGANTLNYVEDKVYCMTGKVASCGEYMWGITDQYYITLTAKGALVDTHCYFSRDEWNRSPNVEVGDIVTFYGTYKFNTMGWNFEDCTFTSPAGTFTIDGDYDAPDYDDYGNYIDTSDDDSMPSVPVDTNYPLGYYEKDGGGAIDIIYNSDDDTITFDFYEYGQSRYWGGIVKTVEKRYSSE